MYGDDVGEISWLLTDALLLASFIFFPRLRFSSAPDSSESDISFRLII